MLCSLLREKKKNEGVTRPQCHNQPFGFFFVAAEWKTSLFFFWFFLLERSTTVPAAQSTHSLSSPRWAAETPNTARFIGPCPPRWGTYALSLSPPLSTRVRDPLCSRFSSHHVVFPPPSTFLRLAKVLTEDDERKTEGHTHEMGCRRERRVRRGVARHSQGIPVAREHIASRTCGLLPVA